MRVIYEPKGRAREYAELAANLSLFCDFACRYCYSASALHKSREKFHTVQPFRAGILEHLEKDLIEMEKNGDHRAVLISFLCDVYQASEAEHQTTRKVIELFIKHNIHCTILTKGGRRSLRDFDLIASRPDLFTYAVTLTFTNEEDRRKYEPHAAPTWERLEALMKFHKAGVQTWVSLEPVISPRQSLDLIAIAAPLCGEFRIGKINHNREIEKSIDWMAFAHDAVSLCMRLGVKYYIKKDLQKYLE